MTLYFLLLQKFVCKFQCQTSKNINTMTEHTLKITMFLQVTVNVTQIIT